MRTHFTTIIFSLILTYTNQNSCTIDKEPCQCETFHSIRCDTTSDSPTQFPSLKLFLDPFISYSNITLIRKTYKHVPALILATFYAASLDLSNNQIESLDPNAFGDIRNLRILTLNLNYLGNANLYLYMFI